MPQLKLSNLPTVPTNQHHNQPTNQSNYGTHQPIHKQSNKPIKLTINRPTNIYIFQTINQETNATIWPIVKIDSVNLSPTEHKNKKRYHYEIYEFARLVWIW